MARQGSAPLTGKQLAFVREYPKDHNATQAAIRAGYAPRSAQQSAVDLFRHPVIYRLLASKAKARTDRLDLQADQTLERWRRLAACDAGLFVDAITGQPLRVCDLSLEAKYALEACEVDADGRLVKWKTSSHAKVAALTFLSKHQELANDAIPVVGPVTVNHTEVHLSGLSTDELRVIERVLQRAEGQTQPALSPPGTTQPIEGIPVPPSPEIVVPGASSSVELDHITAIIGPSPNP